MPQKTIYLPLELKVREFYPKMWLALAASQKGFRSIIGPKSEVQSLTKCLTPGCFFSFGLAQTYAKTFKELKKQGHIVCVIDEEGLVTLNDDLYARYRISPTTIHSSDLIFCWGKRQESIIKPLDTSKHSYLFRSGNPRFDLLRPEFRTLFDCEVDQLKKQHGRFILINTNFGTSNHFMGLDYSIKSLRNKGWMSTPEDEKYFLDRIRWQKKILNEIVKVLPEIERSFPEHNIIIRPHPSEDQVVWQKVVAALSRTRVIHSGNVIPWILASEVLLHNGCTTAVEAFLLNKHTVAFRPVIEKALESELPNAMSLQTHTAQQLIEAISSCIVTSTPVQDKGKKDLLATFLDGMDEKSAAEAIVEALERSVVFQDSSRINGVAEFVRCYFSNSVRKIKSMTKTLLRQSGRKHTPVSKDYLKHKVPGLSLEEVRNAVDSLSKCVNLGIPITIKKLWDNTYSIGSKE